MASGPGTEWLLSDRSHRSGQTAHAWRSVVAPLATLVVILVAPALAAAQVVSPADREAIVRLQTARGGQAQDVDALIRVADETAAKGLPSAPVLNKIREGIAKGVPPVRIGPVVQQLVEHLQMADGLLREGAAPGGAPERATAVTLLAEALGAGVTPAEVRELRRQSQPAGQPPVSAEAVASAARGLAFIKDARLPVGEGTTLVSEAARRGFRGSEMLDLGREIKRRESDYRSGRSTLRALRDAIARGDRIERLFPERPAGADRPVRPDIPAGTADRPVRPETPARPNAPDRPQQPERPGPGR